MQLGVSITDGEGRIVYLNAAEAEMHGYTAAELLGQDARNLSPREHWKALPPRELTTVRKWKRERVRLRKDGSRFPVQLMSDVVTDAAGRPWGLVTTCEDISERFRAEEALRDSEERYALAVRGTNDGIWDWSIKDEKIYLSPRWKQMLGYGEWDLTESPEEWFSRVHPEDRPRVDEKVRRAPRRQVAELRGRVPHAPPRGHLSLGALARLRGARRGGQADAHGGRAHGRDRPARLRPADRPAEPRAVRREAGAGVRPRRAPQRLLLRGHLPRPRPLQDRSTTRSAT